MEKNKITLIDTSIWIEALRKTGLSDVRERVRILMIEGRSAWCDLVAVELWNGAKGDYERKWLAEYENEIICLPTTKDVWELARELARSCRKSGKTVPVSDLVIASCALFHNAEIEHCDTHFDSILGVYQKNTI